MAEVNIGTYWFKTKTEAKNYIREILKDCRDFHNVSQRHREFLSLLLMRHPQAEQKIGAGIDGFSVRTDCTWKKNRHFVVHRIDGTETDFSFLACLDGENPKANVLSALRKAVVDQILSFKNNHMEEHLVCSFTGERLNNENAHVDHVPPLTFDALVKDWMESEGLGFDAIEVTPSRDNTYGRELSHPAQRLSWQKWHRENAKLRIISQKANLSIVKKTRTRISAL